ncbi:MAG: trypsin-like serine protease [Chloroflexi bacterium]|nr:trypsin-like serine protease [Chloroflexota bacterium]
MGKRGLTGVALGALVASVLACGALVTPTTEGSTNTVGEEPIDLIPAVFVDETPTPLPPEFIAEADAEELLLINIYERVSPSVVSIVVSAEAGGADLLDIGNGSGFVYDEEGYIVTNNHVVEGAQAIRVTFDDGMVLNADIIGTDPFADLAVIKVDPPEGYTLVPVSLGDSNEVLVGQRAIAIGNPFALSNSMTVGIVSAVGRTLPSVQRFSNPLIIQTDAPINPGNSGGPLLNSQGEVIGVNTAIRSETGTNSGIGFAVPVNAVKRIAPQLIERGEVQYPFMGISGLGGEITLADLALEFDLPVSQGVLITDVQPGGPADRAGLRGGSQTEAFRGAPITLGGDIIIAIDGVPITNFDELVGFLVANTSVGEEIDVTIIRDGETLTIPLVLAERP